jgi:hypothetical protein
VLIVEGVVGNEERGEGVRQDEALDKFPLSVCLFVPSSVFPNTPSWQSLHSTTLPFQEILTIFTPGPSTKLGQTYSSLSITYPPLKWYFFFLTECSSKYICRTFTKQNTRLEALSTNVTQTPNILRRHINWYISHNLPIYDRERESVSTLWFSFVILPSV